MKNYSFVLKRIFVSKKKILRVSILLKSKRTIRELIEGKKIVLFEFI